MALSDVILEQLEAGIEVPAISEALGVAEEYVREVQTTATKQLIVTSAPGLPSSDDSTGSFSPPARAVYQRLLSALLPQNQQGLVELRDATMKRLGEHIEDDKLTQQGLLQLLKLILGYETKLWALAKPGAETNVDARQVYYTQISVLVDKFAGLSPKELRDVVGTPQALPFRGEKGARIIDGDEVQ